MFKKSLLALALASPAALADDAIERIEVTGDFRAQALQELTDSVSVLSADTLERRHTQALDEALNLVPNVNFSSGASRGRFIQIRGIGERSQFVDPVNPSVGLLVDGFDFSGLGLAGLISDIDQVEVFRGPQGTRFGANALAGLVNIRTQDPSQDTQGYGRLTLANHDSQRLEGALGGSLGGAWSARLSGSTYDSDGDNHNALLGKASNDRSEDTARLKLRYQQGDWQWDLIGLYLDVDNGYDAFSFDNGRTTLSDNPGRDKQRSRGLGSRLSYGGWDKARIVLDSTSSHSDLGYSFDEDWSNPGYCASRDCPYGDYASIDAYRRERDTQMVDLRLVSSPAGRLGQADWVLGLYGRFQDESLVRDYTYGGMNSDIDSDNKALYGQLSLPLDARWRLEGGLRLERWQADYSDSYPQVLSSSETLWGANLDLSYSLDGSLYYLGLSRGYKPGGFNTEGSVAEQYRHFDTETALNLELGAKWWLQNDLSLALSLFHMWRDDMQVKTYQTVTRDDGSTEFVNYLDNAASGRNYGLELEAAWQATDSLRLSGSLGLLNTRYEDFVNAEGQALDGRDQAQAPRWQYHLAADWQLADSWLLTLESEGKDAFYFSDTHNEQSWAFALWHANLAWQHQNWELSLFGRNLFDRRYATRGFGGFGNDPADGYGEHPYYQLGDGRMVGASASYRF
ncbi:TonB-dependent receptor [Gallaecimonas xiamenensis]|uniref:TonB-dependent receptor n=1 Tax=Gallaecimonas xiamenensis 3-C-1 TaxID=745411 RepID=K2K1D7_9GAMM|nr:TonB-dependent receptor [Gallaecimonas xiamenensis]EKE76614.1 TonB-dependent receptor [Gallaecimonas xiamenensis 3-C-1]